MILAGAENYYDYEISQVAERFVKVYVCNDESLMKEDDETTQPYQMERYIKYSDCKKVALETAKHVTLITEFFFTWSNAMKYFKEKQDHSLSVYIRKLPIGYIVIRTVL